MTISAAESKLEKKGYKVTFNFSGNITASKSGRVYTEKSINALIKAIF